MRFISEIVGRFCNISILATYSYDEDRKVVQYTSKSNKHVFSFIRFRECGRSELLKHFWQRVNQDPLAVSC